MAKKQLQKITETYISDTQGYFRMCLIESNDTGIVFYVKKAVAIYCFVGQIILLMLDWPQNENTADLAFSVIITTTFMLFDIAVLQWHFKKDEILKTIRKIDNCIRFENEKIINIATNDNKFRKTITRLIFFSLSFLLASVTVIWLYELLFDYERYYKVIENGNATTKRYIQRYVVQSWVPFDSTASRLNHFLTVAITLGPLTFLVTGFSAVDSLFIGLTTYACTHFKILKYILENIDEFETDRAPISNDNNLILEEKIKAAVIYLDELLDFCESIRKLYDIQMLFQIMWASSFFGLSLIMLSQVSSTDPKFMMDFLTMVIGTVDRVFFCCYYGSKLTFTAEEVYAALYNSNWNAASKSFKRSLLIMMMRTVEPVILTIGGVFPLTLQTFVEILRAGYSIALLIKK